MYKAFKSYPLLLKFRRMAELASSMVMLSISSTCANIRDFCLKGWFLLQTEAESELET